MPLLLIDDTITPHELRTQIAVYLENAAQSLSSEERQAMEDQLVSALKIKIQSQKVTDLHDLAGLLQELASDLLSSPEQIQRVTETQAALSQSKE